LELKRHYEEFRKRLAQGKHIMKPDALWLRHFLEDERKEGKDQEFFRRIVNFQQNTKINAMAQTVCANRRPAPLT
jgi:hypothetical protein